MQRLILEKNALRNYCIENNVAVSFASMDQEVRKSTKETIYNKVFAGEMDIDNGLNLLEDLGVFPVESTIMSLTTSANVRSSPTAIASNNVAIFYDSVNDTWELGAGVWWDNNDYVNDYPPIIIPRIGDTYNVGGYDGLGIALYDTYGDYTTCTLEDTWLYVSAGSHGISSTSRAPTGSIQARYGVFHQFQDYVQIVEGDDSVVNEYGESVSMEKVYFGKHMSVFAVYSGEFANYHGKATFQYVHTWNETQISSVTVGLTVSGTPAGVFSIAFTSNAYQFDTHGYSETIF
ncbi:MAG: hypothetical protein IJD06_09225 [Clostridia bacterium]|nr:hypothetical protein [Clostridia bacterium]